jgi:predicted transcriptional regulator
LRFEEVKELQKQGWSQRAVAQHLGLSHHTVRKYLALDTCPERPSVPQSTSTVTPYLAYLAKRWQAGCQNIKQLHVELAAQWRPQHAEALPA